MQISALNNQASFKSIENNSKRIYDLEQKNEALRWGSEGCNASLPVKEERELNLRREYEALRNKGAIFGCESLTARDKARMSEIEDILRDNNPKTAPIPVECKCEECNPKPTGSNPYGVPDSTFWGDWAR